MLAILPNGKTESPKTAKQPLFHGTNLYSPAQVKASGIPQKGNNWDLLEHCMGHPNSAFRGCTDSPIMQVPFAGAAHWAGADGWVYELVGIPSWHVAGLLDHNTPVRPGQPFGNPPYSAECEIAVPSQIGAVFVVRVYEVFEGRSSKNGATRLMVKEWKQ